MALVLVALVIVRRRRNVALPTTNSYEFLADNDRSCYTSEYSNPACLLFNTKYSVLVRSKEYNAGKQSKVRMFGFQCFECQRYCRWYLRCWNHLSIICLLACTYWYLCVLVNFCLSCQRFLYVYVCMYVYLYVYAYIIHVCVSVCMYACMYVCMH